MFSICVVYRIAIGACGDRARQLRSRPVKSRHSQTSSLLPFTGVPGGRVRMAGRLVGNTAVSDVKVFGWLCILLEDRPHWQLLLWYHVLATWRRRSLVLSSRNSGGVMVSLIQVLHGRARVAHARALRRRGAELHGDPSQKTIADASYFFHMVSVPLMWIFHPCFPPRAKSHPSYVREASRGFGPFAKTKLSKIS